VHNILPTEIHKWYNNIVSSIKPGEKRPRDLDLDLDFIITLPLGLSEFLAERDVSLLHQKKLIGLLVCIHHICVYCLCKATEAKVVRMGGYLVFPTGNKVLCNM
jgi:hypothetical protein